MEGQVDFVKNNQKEGVIQKTNLPVGQTGSEESHLIN